MSENASGLQAELDERRQLQTALAASHAWLASLIASTTDAIVSVDVDQRIVLFNEAASRMFGCRMEEAIGAPLERFIPEHLRAVYRQHLHRLTTGGLTPLRRIQLAMLRVRRSNGEEFPIGVRLIRARVGRQWLLTGIMRDLSGDLYTEEFLQRSETRLQLALEIAQLGVWDVDLATCQVSSNPHLLGMLGYRPGEVEMTREGWLALVHSDQREAVKRSLDDLLAGKINRWQTELCLLSRSGEWRWVLLRAQTSVDAAGNPQRITGIHLDISERKQAEDKLRNLSQHDALTGLPNTLLTYEFGQQILAGCQRGQSQGAVLFIDLDRFKRINDNYGQAVGDATLKEMAHRLKKGLRQEDVVGRLGNDKFLAVLSHLHEADHAAQAALHLLASIARPIHLSRADQYQDLELQPSASIGISVFPDHGTDLETLIKLADSAMYRAKANGGDTYCFYSAPN